MVLLMAALGVSLQALNDVMSKKHRLLRPTQRYLIEKHKLMGFESTRTSLCVPLMLNAPWETDKLHW